MKFIRISINLINYFFFSIFLFSVYIKISDFQYFIYKLARSEVFIPKLVKLIAYMDLCIEVLLLFLLAFLSKRKLTAFLTSGILFLYGIFVFYVQQYGNYCGCINLFDFGENHLLSLAFNLVVWLISLVYLFLIFRFNKPKTK